LFPAQAPDCAPGAVVAIDHRAVARTDPPGAERVASCAQNWASDPQIESATISNLIDVDPFHVSSFETSVARALPVEIDIEGGEPCAMALVDFGYGHCTQPFCGKIAKALGLRKVYVAKPDGD
jgi:hypothetical protein